MAGQQMRQFRQELAAGIYGGTMSNGYAASVMRDKLENEVGLYCTPRRTAEQQVDDYRKKFGAPPAQVLDAAADSGARTRRSDKVSDPVNKPAHYRAHPSGIECIQVTEHMGFNIGNAVKYLWRCDLKNDAIEDLEKSIWYIRREIDKRKKAAA